MPDCKFQLAAAVLTVWVASAIANIDWKGNNWAFGCDFRGNDIFNVRSTYEQCSGRCALTKGCTHFTWTTFNGGTCWMKRGKVSKRDAFATSNKSMVCGVVIEDGNSGGVGSMTGFTTRYWDCCKPSCSWPDKVPGNNKYARACYQDGFGTVINPNGRSGCDGGPVFTCNNHQPWAVNDNLAYGFAAANVPGLDEKGRCCACYKLGFTNGPVQGKTMIIQVTNSAVDVQPNQFQLLIPGGGLRIFNGCSAQWFTPVNGWGNRFAGVNARNSCNAMPIQIRSGCFWRFDWFMNANNPTMVYSRVRCPDELVAASSCRRDDEP